ncbi:MAG: D-Ala-D-Ala carboxypeptidase [Bacteroidetes bacterium]|nr:MAG: D-Ala-D-Ala carboxypeptidase [Bacteroidota bacterium]
MKKNIILQFAVFLLMVFLTFSCTKDETEPQSPNDLLIQEELLSMTDKLLSDYKKNCPEYPGGLALKVISKNGSWFVSSGLGTGITDQVHFRAASNTKLFTSTAILLLAQQGKVNIDAVISDTIPGTTMTYVPLTANYQVPFRDMITIRQLLQHRAGIFDVTNEYIPDTVPTSIPYRGMYYVSYVLDSDSMHNFSFDELVGVNAECHLSYFQPGGSYHYSNTGYSILGKIIERVSGQSYQQFVMEHIVQPMGMENTSFPYLSSDRTIPLPFVSGFKYSPGNIIDCTESNMSLNVAEGNLITTPDDLSKFLLTLIEGNGVLLPFWVNQVLLAPPAGSLPSGWYGCGIFYSMNLGFGHNGAHEGYLSRMATDPTVGFTVVAFTNSWDLSTENSLRDQLNFLVDEACYRAKIIVQ